MPVTIIEDGIAYFMYSRYLLTWISPILDSQNRTDFKSKT